MLLQDFFRNDELKREIEGGYISEQKHPTLPLRILNYTHKCQIEGRWNPVTKFCRGVIYSPQGMYGHIIARGFPKFFNLGEKHGLTLDTFTDAQRNGRKVNILEKLDGSMGIIWRFLHEGVTHTGVATRGSFTSPQAIWATNWLTNHMKTYKWPTYIGAVTPVVEIIYPENRIVVDYEGYSGLILLGLVGETNDLERRHCRAWATKFGLPLVRGYAGKSMHNLAKETRNNFEGYVITYTDAYQTHRAKVKLDEYCRLHKIITGWNAKQVWKELKDGRDFSDLLSDSMPKHFTKWLSDTIGELKSRFNTVEKAAKAEFEKRTKEVHWHVECPTRRDYAAEFTKNETLYPILFNMLDGKRYEDIIWEKIKPKANEPFLLDGEVGETSDS